MKSLGSDRDQGAKARMIHAKTPSYEAKEEMNEPMKSDPEGATIHFAIGCMRTPWLETQSHLLLPVARLHSRFHL